MEGSKQLEEQSQGLLYANFSETQSGDILTTTPFHRGGNRGSEKASDLPKVT